MLRQELLGYRRNEGPIRIRKFTDGHEVGSHETRNHAGNRHKAFGKFVSVRLTRKVGFGPANRHPDGEFQGVRVGSVFYDDCHELMLDGFGLIKCGVMNVDLAVVAEYHRRFDARALESWLTGSLHRLASGLVSSKLIKVLPRWEDDGHRT